MRTHTQYSLHEAALKTGHTESLLLDIDHRYVSVYSQGLVGEINQFAYIVDQTLVASTVSTVSLLPLFSPDGCVELCVTVFN